MDEVTINAESQDEKHKKIVMTKFNEDGDWLEVKRVIDQIGEILITREIKYW